jgi:hypothetical protein
MSTSSENVKERDPGNQPSGPTPRGGGDISGRGEEIPGADSNTEQEQREGNDDKATPELE